MSRSRVIVVGLGSISRFWIPTLQRHQELELMAVVDPNVEGAAAMMAQLGFDCPLLDTLGEALERFDADLVVNLTPITAHRTVIEAALAAGCEVLTEKPLAKTLNDALALVGLSERSGHSVGVMQNHRSTPHARRIRAEVEAGAIGAASSFAMELTMSLAPIAELAKNDHPMLREMAIHAFDLGRYLAGEEAVSVIAHEFTPPNSWYAGPPAAVCIFELLDGGVFTFHGNWAAPGHSTTFNGRWRIAGTRGTVIWDGRSDPVCEIEEERTQLGLAAPPQREPWHIDPDDDDPTGHRACIESLLAALQTRQPAETDCRDHVNSLAMVAAALRSARERRWVTIAEVLADAAGEAPVDCA